MQLQIGTRETEAAFGYLHGDADASKSLRSP